MEVYEITGFKSGIDREGVNFLDPADAFELIKDGFIYRQVLQSRLGFNQFANRLGSKAGEQVDGTRVMGIFENILPDGNRQLLVCSKLFLYKYTSTTNTFDQIPFNARILALNPVFNFGITNNEHYVSGTSYLQNYVALGSAATQRFVFTGQGMTAAPLSPGFNNSGVFFYDGTSVGDFFNVTDNPTVQEPSTTIGNVLKAIMVVFFNGRLNFIVPFTTVPVNTYYQGILFSGIQNAAGNGDKFNVAGSGMLVLDTYEQIKGALIMGDQLICQLQRSSWVAQKTTDAFNPYLSRKIPSVLGTDAGFSAVTWAYEVKSVGETGLITTDGRQSLRFDNKIPYFTSEEIDQANIGLTYGGFDRFNTQFLFAYRNNTSTDVAITQDKVLVYNYKENTFAVNDQRFSVFGQSDEGRDLPWNMIDELQDPSWLRMDDTENIWNQIGIGEHVQKTLAGDDLGFVYQINQDYEDYYINATGITQAANAVVTVNECALQVGDRVLIENVLGMTEINGLIGTILSITTTNLATTSITLDINSTLFSLYVSGGSVSKLIAFEAQLTPFNPYRSQGRKVFVSHIEVLLNNNGGNVTVSMFEDGETTPFKQGVLLTSSQTSSKDREWRTVIVGEECNFFYMVFANESAGSQTIITSIRLHISAGSFTTA